MADVRTDDSGLARTLQAPLLIAWRWLGFPGYSGRLGSGVKKAEEPEDQVTAIALAAAMWQQDLDLAVDGLQPAAVHWVFPLGEDSASLTLAANPPRGPGPAGAAPWRVLYP